MSIRPLLCFPLLFACTALLPLPANASTGGTTGVRILRSTPEVLEISIPGDLFRDEPAASFLIGVPAGATPVLEVLEVRRQRAPLPPPGIRPESPEEEITLSAPFTFRLQQMCALRVPLVTAAGAEVNLLAGARLRIRFEHADASPGIPLADPLFEGVYRSALLNYEEARAWRTPPRTVGAVRRPQTEGEALLLGTTADGWYSLSLEEVRAAGIPDPPIGPAGYRLFRGRTELPLYVGGDATLSFFGLRPRKGADDAEPLSDTTVYRLISGSVPGLRYAEADSPSGGDTLASVVSTVVSERNTGYFTGTTELEVIENDPVAGEGWYWSRIFPGQRVEVPLDIPFADTAGTDGLLGVRLVSMTPDSPGVDHRVRIFVNDSLLGVRELDGRTVAFARFPLPGGGLRTDGNTLSLVSDPTAWPVNLVALDRAEVTYRRRLQASGDLLLFTDSAGPGVRTYSAGGFADSTLRILDTGIGRRVRPHTVHREPAGRFRVIWSDSGPGPRSYCVVSGAGTRSPSGMRLKRMTDPSVLQGGTDLIILTHPALRASAERLAAHRRAGSALRVVVVDVEEVYHAFGDGGPDPAAIREFLRTAYASWQAPPPSAMLLLGDASWDPRGFLPTTRRRDLIPAYGVPAGDAWFGLLDSSGVPVLQIGRLPAADPLEADLLVSKLLQYDAAPADAWVKRFLFLTGGVTPAERTTYRTRSETLIRDFILPDPVAGDPRRIYKSTDVSIDAGLRDSVRREINGGVLFLNYLGHSSAQSWGIDIGSPMALGNTGGRLPFVASVSCNIGAFAEPSGNVLAEDLLLAEGRGSVAVWSSSSLGYPTPGTQLVRFALSGVTSDTLRGLGELTTAALLRLRQTDPTDPVVRAMVRLNPLLGDPLTRLVLPVRPDAAVNDADLDLRSPGSGPSGAGGGLLRAKIRNNGLSLGDSVDVRVTVRAGSADPPVVDRMLRLALRREDSIEVSWRADPDDTEWHAELGLDPDQRLAEADESNNTGRAAATAVAPGLLGLWPLPDQQVAPGPVEFVVAAPPRDDSSGGTVVFSLDTTGTFSSPWLRTSGPLAVDDGSVRWVSPPVGEDGLYFWRASSPVHAAGPPAAGGAFTVRAGAPSGARVRIAQEFRRQFARSEPVGLLPSDSGLTIAPPAAVTLRAESFGGRADPVAGAYSNIRYGDRRYDGQWWVAGRSFIALRVRRDGTEGEFRGFDCAADAAQADSMLAFLRRMEAGEHCAVAAVLDGSTNVSVELRQELAALGSARIQDVRPGDSWAFVVRKGDPGSASEELSQDTAAAERPVVPVRDTLEGTLIGPLLVPPVAWDSLRWDADGEGPPGQVTLLLRRRLTGAGAETLAIARGFGGSISLRALDSLTVRSGVAIEPVIVLSSRPGVRMPVLRSWSVENTPPPELLVRPPAVVSSGTSGVVTLRGLVKNLGRTAVRRARLEAVAVRTSGDHPVAAVEIGAVAAGGRMEYSMDIPLPDVSGGRLALRFEPLEPAGDLLPSNNAVMLRLAVPDSVRYPFRVLADGAPLADGDVIAAEPVITAVLPGWYAGQRIVGVRCHLDGVPVPPGEDGTTFRPFLQGGEHRLELVLVKENRAGGVDTLGRSMRVRVEVRMRVRELYGFPNPFADRTLLSFTVTGTQAPVRAVLRVYTVSGRKVREIIRGAGEVRVGITTAEWDGRDEDGDPVANGVYLLQLTVEGADGLSETVRQKIVRAR